MDVTSRSFPLPLVDSTHTPSHRFTLHTLASPILHRQGSPRISHLLPPQHQPPNLPLFLHRPIIQLRRPLPLHLVFLLTLHPRLHNLLPPTTPHASLPAMYRRMVAQEHETALPTARPYRPAPLPHRKQTHSSCKWKHTRCSLANANCRHGSCFCGLQVVGCGG
jgi:hypothetical protein